MRYYVIGTHDPDPAAREYFQGLDAAKEQARLRSTWTYEEYDVCDVHDRGAVVASYRNGVSV